MEAVSLALAVSLPSPQRREPIAIVGIGCRLPGIGDPRSFWRALREARNLVGEIPEPRWSFSELFDPRPGKAGRICSRWGGVLETVDQFDAEFFGIPRHEAMYLDPQQRLLLEVSWEALEDAGQVPSALAGTLVGVFVGLFLNDYANLVFSDTKQFDMFRMLGALRSGAAARVSHAYDFRGPAVVLDTACSSSLTAAHMACQSLWSGESNVALVGGAQLNIGPHVDIAFSHARMLAADGRCKFGDRGADGIVRSEGVAMVVLKPLGRALADGDSIYALIRGSAINHDGATGGSLVTPGAQGQEDLLRAAYRRAGVAPAEVDYVEAHGTGTPTGDPIEVAALSRVFGDGRPAQRPLRVGSVKTNLGHTDAVSGLTGLIKTALSLTHEEIPASLHFEAPNPDIPWAELPLEVTRELTPWPRGARPRWAGVSSFGISGSNAHFVLEEAPAAAPREQRAEDGPGLLMLSAKSPEGLADLASSYVRFLAAEGAALPWQEVCAATALRREHLDHRLALVAAAAPEAAEALRAHLAGNTRPGLSAGTVSGGRPRIAFVFSGHGSQWAGMGRELMADSAFRGCLEQCEAAIRPLAGFSLLHELAAGEERSRLDEPEITQLAIFAQQVAQAALWRSWGVEPDAVVGHSMGEIAAAHVAGALELGEAVRVVWARSRAIRPAVGRGGVAVVDLTAGEAEASLRGYAGLSLAGSNGPRSTVVSGDLEPLAAWLEAMRTRGVFCRRVRIDYASHSAQMEEPRRELERLLDGLAARPAALSFYSTVEAAAVEGTALGPAYWGRNLRQPVRFAEALDRLVADGVQAFVELGGHPVLATAVQESLRRAPGRGLVVATSRRRQERATLLASVGALHAAGVAVAWRRVHPLPAPAVPLPSYRWQRSRFWLDGDGAPATPAEPEAARDSRHPLLGRRLSSAAAPVHFWESDLSLRALPYLRDHVIEGVPVLPAAGILELVLAAAAATLGERVAGVEAFRFERAIVLGDEPRRLQLVMTEEGASRVSFRIFGRAAAGAEPWTSHSSGTLLLGGASDFAGEPLAAVRERCPREHSRREAYAATAARGLAYGPRFRNVAGLWRGVEEAVARIEMPSILEAEIAAYGYHPALFDAGMHAMLVARLLDDRSGDGRTLVPLGMTSVTLHRWPGPVRWCQIKWRELAASAGGGFEGDVLLRDEDEEPVLEIRGLRLQPIHRAFGRAAPGISPAAPEGAAHELVWEEVAAAASDGLAGGWLLLGSGGGLAAALAARIEAAGGAVLAVGASESCDLSDRRRGTVRPDQAEDHAALIAAARKSLPRPWRGIVHLWSLDAAAPGESGAAALERAEVYGSESVFLLVQALLRGGAADTPRLVLVTRGAQPAGADRQPLAVAQAPLWGLGRVLASEHPELRCRLVDLGPDGTAGFGPADLDALAAELGAADTESQIAWRGGARRAARLRRTTLATDDSGSFAVDADGWHLVTGGLGGIGLKVAEWLVGRGARRLALLARRPPGEAARAAVARLEAAGAAVLVLQADVADAGQVAAALARLAATGVRLAGVFHAAGLTDDRLLQHLDRESFRAVTAAKVRGSWNLHEQTAGAPLDAFVLFSSASALLGSPGHGNYAAGNAFLDALAHHRRALGLPALSVNWGLWTEIGLITGLGDGGDRLVQRGFRGFSPAQGIAALELLLGGGRPQVGVMPMDWQAWRQFYPTVAALPVFAPVTAPAPAAAAQAFVGGAGRVDREAVMAAAPEGRPPLILAYLSDLLLRLLGQAAGRLAPEDSLHRLGVDSLVGIEVKNRLEADLGVTMSMVALLQGSSVAQLAREIEGRLAGVEESAAPGAAAGASAPAGAAWPLSHEQQALWYLHQVAPESAAFNCAYAARLRSPVDRRALQRALQLLLDRHAALRSTFEVCDGAPVQRERRGLELPFASLDAAGWDEDRLRLEVLRASRQSFDLERGPLLRAGLFTCAADDHVLLLTAHHVACDGWSLFLLLDELRQAYAALRQGRSPELPAPAASYADYVRWQAELLAGKEGERLWAYWRERLAGDLPPLDLPTDCPRPAVPGYRGASHRFVWDGEISAGLRQLGAEESATLYMVVAAAYLAVLRRLARCDEVLLGTSTRGRPQHRFAQVVGHFVNPVVLRADLSGDPTFRELLRRVRRTALGAFEHQDFPFPLLVERLRQSGEPASAPLYRVSLLVQNFAAFPEGARELVLGRRDGAPVDFGGLLAEPFDLEQQEGQLDLDLEVHDAGDHLRGALQFDTDLFRPQTAARIVEQLEGVLRAVVARPDASLHELDRIERRRREQDRARRKAAVVTTVVRARRQAVRLPAAAESAE